MQASFLDLGPRARAVFAAAYVALLLVAITHGQTAPDHVFGFQMFNESSKLRITLFREVNTPSGRRLVPVVDGAWRARDETNRVRTFRWNDRVRTGPIRRLDRFVHASYGLDAQLFRLERALLDVAQHTSGDRETRALVAVVDTLKNGRDPRTLRIQVVR